MPSWFSPCLIANSQRVAANNRRPSATTPQSSSAPTEEESEYEEIENPKNYYNMNPPPQTESDIEGRTCALCGSINPLVICEMCNNQLFCASCNDMFHRHPRRHSHRRKLLEAMQNRPPLPSTVHQLHHHHHLHSLLLPQEGPVPPPRRQKKLGIRSANASPTSLRRFPFDPLGSLRRFVGSGSAKVQRPLPMAPQHQYFSDPRNFPVATAGGTLERRQSAPLAPKQNARPLQHFQARSESIANPGFNLRNGYDKFSIPLTVMEFGRNKCQQISVKGADKHCLVSGPPSRDSGWDDDDEELMPRSHRSFSVSACNPKQFPALSSESSPFGPDLRRGNSKPPGRPPPPVPPRDFSQPRPMKPTLSAFELNRGGGGAFVPWQSLSINHVNRPEDLRATLKRNQACLEQAMSLVELNLKDLSRLESESQPAYGNQPEMVRDLKHGLKQKPFSSRHASPLTPQVPPEPDYYSGDDSAAAVTTVADVDLDDFTESPEGPWTCEHCTFVNPKSSRACTICCKTPLKGYLLASAPTSDKHTRSRSKNRSKDALIPSLSVSTTKSQPCQLSLKNVAGTRKPVKQPLVAASASFESSDESESDESSSDEITEKHRAFVRESKSTLKQRRAADEKAPIQTSGVKMVDSATGDYAIDSKLPESPKLFQDLSSTKEHKASIGTSPPPQTISTQTYEELPSESKMSSKSISKISLQSSALSRESSPPREMSEKALRYARRAQQHSHLKRSMSAHLTTASPGTNDAWTSQLQQHEGRQLYRTSSRQSLASDTRSLPISGPPSRDISPPSRRFEEFGQMNRYGPMAMGPWDRFPCPAEYFPSFEDPVERKRRDSSKSQEVELSRLLKEAEELNYTPADLQVAIRMCGGNRNPLKWLEDNWVNMVETVQTLATKFGRDKGQDFNEVGTISALEAKQSLRMHKGNVWAAVTECVEQRRRKFLELQSRGTFLREDILTALTANKGNLDAAYVELSKNQLKPFLMRIWGPPIGRDNESVPPVPRDQTPPALPQVLPSDIRSQESPKLANVSNPLSVEHKEKPEEEEMFYDPEPAPGTNVPLEIDDTEEQVSTFIQNYEVPVPSPGSASPPLREYEDAQIGIEGQDKPIDVSLTTSEVESLLEVDTTSLSSSQAIDTLSKTVNLIAEKLGILLNHQEISCETNIAVKTIEKEKVGESQKCFDTKITPESTPLFPIKIDEAQTLQQIYKEDLSLLKDTVLLPQDASATNYQQNEAPRGLGLTSINIQGREEKATEPLLPRKKKASKIYEVLGSFFRNSKTKPEPVEPEDLYETMTVAQGSMELGTREYTAKNLNQSISLDLAEASTNISQGLADLDEMNGILEVEHDFSFGESSESEADIENTEYVSGDEFVEEELNAKWSEVALALNQATFEAVSHTNSGVELLLQSGRVNSMEKAQLAFKLMDMNFSESDSIYAANECSSLYTAISFLQQECQLCTGKFSARQIISMLRCSHSCCRTCAAEYFIVQIRDQSILRATCPFCHEPSNLTEDSDAATDYFSHLEILLKDILDQRYYEMFGRKLRDWTLAQTPNFKWCSKCSSGFITEPLQTPLVCPDCNAVTCAICLEPWDKFNHDHRDQADSHLFCEEAPKPLASIVDYLNENNIQCPKCRWKFALARGGCMHMTCSQCRYEFCSGCSAPFAMGLRCKENTTYCDKLGLHAHHPRNCLFYLRDKEPEVLMKLLTDANIPFVDNAAIQTTEERKAVPTVKCVVALQRESPDGLVDEQCGQAVQKGCNEICPSHFTEYLSLLVYENGLDPIPILTSDDLETIVKRACKRLPPRPYGTSDDLYRPLLLQVIEEEIPL